MNRSTQPLPSGSRTKAALEIAIDVKRARSRQIRPLDLGDRDAAAMVAPDAGSLPDLALEEPPSFIEEIVVTEKDEPVERLEKWKRRLLDLTLRNKLLNFKDTKNSIGIECPAPARLEDLLSAGHQFKLLSRANVLDERDQRDFRLFQERYHDDGRARYVLQALDRDEIHTTVSEGELDGRLTELFRISRTAFEEGGSNILFLVLGFLRWSREGGATPYRAPLLLIPVSLQRSSVRAGFRLALHEDEARINPTLLELLRQDFDLQIPELEKELPTDDFGIDVARVWQIVRTHVRDLKGWEVSPDIVLSTVSYTKFLMWKDLVDRTEILKLSPVVRHLIDTPTQSYGERRRSAWTSTITRRTFSPRSLRTPRNLLRSWRPGPAGISSGSAHRERARARPSPI
jgi:Protein of unknown function (DUF4011)